MIIKPDCTITPPSYDLRSEIFNVIERLRFQSLCKYSSEIIKNHSLIACFHFPHYVKTKTLGIILLLIKCQLLGQKIAAKAMHVILSQTHNEIYLLAGFFVGVHSIRVCVCVYDGVSAYENMREFFFLLFIEMHIK